MGNDAIAVEVTNFPTATEEQEPQHFTTSGFVLPPAGITVNGPTQILQLDPLRKKAVISFNGSGGVFLAHSSQQAQSLQSNVNQNGDEGAMITAPATITVEGQAELWAIGAATGNNAQQSVPGYGAVIAATAGQAIATIPAADLPAGTYEIYLLTYIDGTATSADEDNIQLETGGTEFTQLVQPAGASVFVVPSGPWVVSVNGAQSISVNTVGIPSGTASYHASIDAVPLLTSAGLTVGVVQERRNVNQ